MSSPKDGNLAEVKFAVYPTRDSTDSKHLMLDSRFAESGPVEAGFSISLYSETNPVHWCLGQIRRFNETDLTLPSFFRNSYELAG